MKIPYTLKRLLCLGFWCMIHTLLWSQITIGNGDCNLNINIPDNNCIEVAIPISGAPGNQLGQNVFLEEVKLIISHGWRNDLQVMLISPDGNTEVKLINERGGSSDHFGQPNGSDCSNPFILSDSFCSTDSVKNMSSSTEAFGVFTPEENLSNLYLPIPFDPNATWTLKICDDKSGDIGILNYAELIFIPSGCIAPTELTAFNIRATTIDLDWNNNNVCAGNVIVEYGPAGFTPGNGTTAGAPNSQVVVLPCFEEFDIAGLTELTTYDIYVRQTCGPYNYFYNSCKVTATTGCILPPVTLSENFNNQLDCGVNGDCIACPTISGVWSNSLSDDVDWIVNDNSTATSGTGPTSDAEFNGKYIYLESSRDCQFSKEAVLISQCIEVDASVGICHLSFFYHMFGVNVNSLALDITTDGTNWITIWEETGNQGNEWLRQYINLSAYDGMIVQFRFKAISPVINFRGDIGLDKIDFYGSQVKPSDVFYADVDGDGFGNPNDSIAVCFSAQPTTYVANNLDCDDTDSTINPNAVEIPCNGIDENCNGVADDVVIFNPTFSTSAICSGETASITVTSSNGGQIYWFDNANAINPIDSGVTFNSPILNAATDYYFKESKNFSGQTCESSVIQVDITVNEQPSITNASGNQNICQNTAFDLRSLVIQDVNNTIDTILYFTNDSYSNAAIISNPIVAITSDTIFYIQAKSNSGCTDELPVSFFRQSTPTAIINAPDSLKLCFQDDPQLITGSEGGTGTGPFDYNWSTGSQTNEAIIFSRSKGFAQTISLTITSPINGCSATDQVIVYTQPSISTIEVTDIQEPGFCEENGAIIIEPRDGQAPYDYMWSGAISGNSNGITTTNYTISDLEMGAYNITVTDNFGCSKTVPQQFVNGPDLGIDNITDVSCFGQNNGSITIRVGGLINPTYQWSDGTTVFSTNQNVSALSGGVYSVTVDADNASPCPIDSIIINEPPLLELLNKNIIAPSCVGISDASIELAVTGGTPSTNGYNFNWDNSLPNNSNPQNLSASTYQVTITDANGCTTSDTTVIEPTLPIQTQLTATNPTCFDYNDGEISTLIMGGTSPYSYQWNDDLNQTTPIAYGLIANTYTLTITDANGCEEIVNESLVNPTVLTAQVATIESPLCNEIEDGVINLNVVGGTGTYHYQWNRSDTTATLMNVGEGLYSVVILDDNSCVTNIDSILVTAPELMDISFTTIQDPLCLGVDNGMVEVGINGGVAPYGFVWNNGRTTRAINNLKPSDYFVTVSDANGCTSISDTANLIAPQLLEIDNYLVVDSIQCKDMDNGVVFYRVSSDAPNANTFSFQWQDSTLITDNSIGFWLSSDYTTLSAGNYGLEIQDNVGCTLETTFEVTEPGFLEIDTILVEAPSCFGENDGNAIANIQGGTGPYTYSWTLPNNEIIRTSTELLPDIDGGNYQVEIIDANNCVSAAYPFEVESSSSIEIIVDRIQQVSCSSPENGSIDISATGGRGTYDFEWNNGLLTEDLQNLDAGIYTVTLTDAAECSISKAFEIQLEEDSLQVELIAVENPQCNNNSNGSIEIKVNGGFGSYQYFWNNGIQTIDGDTTSLENLSSGNYNVSVIDESNDFLCVGFLNDLILTPAVNISVSLDDFENELDCFGDNNGAFYISTTGGTAPYHYLWSNGDTSQNQVSLTAGNYTLTITDASNCEWQSGELFPEILEPTNPLTITSRSVTDSLCVGDASGQIDLAFSGGITPYNFNWNNGANTASIQNLLPGYYAVTATDENDCILQFDTTIAIKADELSVSLFKSDLTCFDDNSGFIQANVICGVPPYRYLWNTGDTTETLINLSTGSYLLTITDAAGQTMETFDVLRSPPLLKVDSIIIDIINCEGIIDLDVSGGVSNSYNFTWRDESETIISTSRNATNLAAGTYKVTIQDANNCTIVLDDLTIDNELIIDSIFTSSSYNPQSNRGTLRVDSIRGGTAPYSYLWYNEANEIIGTNAIVTGVLAGDYYVVVSDQNDCDIQQNQVIEIPDGLIDLEEVETVSVYPNPTNDVVYLDIQFNEPTDIQISLITALGEQVFQTEQQRTDLIYQKIDLSNYAAGLFYLKITINNSRTYGEKVFYIKN